MTLSAGAAKMPAAVALVEEELVDYDEGNVESDGRRIPGVLRGHQNGGDEDEDDVLEHVDSGVEAVHLEIAVVVSDGVEVGADCQMGPAADERMEEGRMKERMRKEEMEERGLYRQMFSYEGRCREGLCMSAPASATLLGQRRVSPSSCPPPEWSVWHLRDASDSIAHRPHGLMLSVTSAAYSRVTRSVSFLSQSPAHLLMNHAF